MGFCHPAAIHSRICQMSQVASHAAAPSRYRTTCRTHKTATNYNPERIERVKQQLPRFVCPGGDGGGGVIRGGGREGGKWKLPLAASSVLSCPCHDYNEEKGSFCCCCLFMVFGCCKKRRRRKKTEIRSVDSSTNGSSMMMMALEKVLFRQKNTNSNSNTPYLQITFCLLCIADGAIMSFWMTLFILI
jgi:hypothetical protein